MGSTTSFLALSPVLRPPRVISLEPSDHFFATAERRLAGLPNVRLVNAASEEALEDQLLSISDSAANFWLDGHYSGGSTTLFNGVATPIEYELGAISRHAKRFNNLAVFVDDTRLFGNSLSPQEGYPNLSALVKWADRLRLSWFIEHDIFVAKGGSHA